MLKRLHEGCLAAELVTITFEGKQLLVPVGETVLASVMVAGAGYNRTSPISGVKRAGYCQMGVCFECLMEIDGVPNQQACAIQVSDGMVVNRQDGKKVLANG
ncbi:sarcosine oxidase subunit alpha [Vibrio sp. 10N.286.49.C2]|uniref:(2Fe-2S)-binding protein n=1 Tax=unclassified Vibrio TaxID=2614977 RepID=UPI000C84CCA6|nr:MULTISPECIES: (2Fe-2S)-binding protein [unclassified Vibrio]PMH42933.1 sarcosine oxidase subunit alpha [Vibrio sp. 10N.286.49.C2]PMH53728.1 sarcosine oxidase subunit alpha [Vibrio sp. 10N.286.49.B1]PMH81250.1 sarcosine oxidase subunit alpha [Vibrio sp. 10N.286.48.B7]